MNLQSWDDQIRESLDHEKVETEAASGRKQVGREKDQFWKRKIGEITKKKSPPTNPKDRMVLALERIARSNERLATEFAWIAWILFGWTLVTLLFGLKFMTHGL